MGAESFTVLAVLEARDRASEVFAKVDESLGRFSETAKGAADTAAESGARIDEALGRTVSASDRLEVADARVAGAQAKARQAAEELTAAERELLDAQRAAAQAGDADAAAQDRLVAASKGLAGAQKEAAVSAKGLRDAQASQVTAVKAAAAAGDENAAAQLRARQASEGAGISLGAMGKVAGITALGLGVAAGIMVKAAGNFQDSTTHLMTDAGESARNLGMARAGILQVSTATGQSAAAITQAMYHIESGGFHAQAGLNMLKVAAEGARVGGADLDTTTFALVGAMNAYRGAGYTATQMMNAMIATTAAGDLKMQDLASSLHSVAPIAAAAHISFAEVGGAIATMTAQGMSAQQATQDLGHVIGLLASPTSVMSAEMNQLGINAQDVQQHLGQRGLTGTLTLLTQAITSHMGKSGQVIMSAFTQSTTAGQALQAMLKTMPSQFRAMAKGFMDGSVTAKQWRAELQAQTPVNAHLMQQFATLYEKSHSFNDLLAKGGPAAQTYTAALAKATGGQTGLNVALMLSGGHMGDFRHGVASVGDALSSHAKDVENWSAIQGTFNYKLASAKTAVENTGIAIGSALLPAATSLLQAVTAVVEPVAAWTAGHRTLTAVLFGGVAALAATVAAVAMARKAYSAVTGTVDTVRKGLQLVGLASKAAAETQAASAGEAAAAQEGAAARSSLSWIASTARTVAASLAGAAATAAAWVAANAAMTLGIGLVIAAVVAAVILIVKHWKQISAAVARVWHDVYSFVARVVSDVIGFVKGHWPLLLAVIAGPLGLAVYAVVKYWGDIKRWFSEGVRAAIAVVTWYFVRLPEMFYGWLGRAASAVESAGSRVLGWFRSLPGRIASLVAGIPAMLFGSGTHIIESLANGIVSGAGSFLHSAMSSVASLIKSYLPFSPAKQGPLSGAGDPGNSGLSITRLVARGIVSGTPRIAGAASQMAASVAAATTGLGGAYHLTGSALAPSALSAVPAGGAGGGGVTIVIDVHGNTVMSDSDTDKLIGRIERRLVAQVLPAAGRRARG